LNPEQLYDLRQRSDYVMRAIGKLDINLRTPLTTWIEQECSMKEVARTLDLTLATVKTRLHRARKQLTCPIAFKEPLPNAEAISGSKHQFVIRDSQNRGMPCPSCD
jgi:hypothetical protein